MISYPWALSVIEYNYSAYICCSLQTGDKIPALLVQTYATCFTLLILPLPNIQLLICLVSEKPCLIWGLISLFKINLRKSLVASSWHWACASFLKFQQFRGGVTAMHIRKYVLTFYDALLLWYINTTKGLGKWKAYASFLLPLHMSILH